MQLQTISQRYELLRIIDNLNYFHIKMNNTHTHPRLPHPQIHLLSASEWKVLKYVANNLNSKDIAARMFVTPKSIDNYKNRISKKLELHGHRSLYSFAIQNKYLLDYWNEVLQPRSSQQ